MKEQLRVVIRYIVWFTVICLVISSIHFISEIVKERKGILHLAVEKGDYINVYDHVWRKGRDVNGRYLGGLTPLMFAARNEDIKIAEMLIDAGADINAKNHDGDTAFNYAADWENLQMMEFLWENGAGLNTRDRYRGTPLHKARSVKVAKWLIDKGAIVDARNRNGETPLLDQCGSLMFEPIETLGIIHLIIRNGADVKAVDGHNETALHKMAQWASSNNEKGRKAIIEIVKLLVKQGVDIHAVNHMELTAKENAEFRGNSQLVGIFEEYE